MSTIVFIHDLDRAWRCRWFIKLHTVHALQKKFTPWQVSHGQFHVLQNHYRTRITWLRNDLVVQWTAKSIKPGTQKKFNYNFRIHCCGTCIMDASFPPITPVIGDKPAISMDLPVGASGCLPQEHFIPCCWAIRRQTIQFKLIAPN